MIRVHATLAPASSLLTYVPLSGTFMTMKVAHQKLVDLCQERNMSVSKALKSAGVSRNAYYSLARKQSILPASIDALANTLGVAPAEILDETSSVITKAHQLASEVDRIVQSHRGVDRDNVRHTLLLLDEKPISRLRRALRRGQRINIQS